MLELKGLVMEPDFTEIGMHTLSIFIEEIVSSGWNIPLLKRDGPAFTSGTWF